MNRSLPEPTSSKFAQILLYLLIGCGLTLCTLAVSVSYLPGQTIISSLAYGKPMPFVVQDQSNRTNYSREFEMPPYPAFPLKWREAQKTSISPFPFLGDVVFWAMASFLISWIGKVVVRWVTRDWVSNENERIIT